jgi:hypothetical protein
MIRRAVVAVLVGLLRPTLWLFTRWDDRHQHRQDARRV